MHTHVRTLQGFAQLASALAAKRQAGQAPFYKTTYGVLPNSYMGIRGGYEVCHALLCARLFLFILNS